MKYFTKEYAEALKYTGLVNKYEAIENDLRDSDIEELYRKREREFIEEERKKYNTPPPKFQDRFSELSRVLEDVLITEFDESGQERFSFVPKLCTDGMNIFIGSRSGDPRTNAVKSVEALKEGDIFYITCIDKPEKLESFYHKYKDKYHCVYQTDFYTNKQWLEIMPIKASKSNAIRQLQEMLTCEKLIVFGDGKNDIDMFQIGDESYAVANADEELKAFATDIILSNDEDGVAKWLVENF